MKPYVIWKVNEDKEFKCKLTSSAVTEIESRYKCNLLDFVEGMPSLTIMLDVTHKAIKKFHHGIKEKDMFDLFDEYVDNGGSQITFMTEVFIPIYKVSGFFPKAVAENMDEKLSEATEKMNEM